VKVLINSENKVLYCVALKGAETLAKRASKELYLLVKNFICIDRWGLSSNGMEPDFALRVFQQQID